MATFEVTVPDTLVLGRNGAIGELAVDWTKVPQHVLNHIAAVYFPQYITDAANAGGKEESQSDRMARAMKKLDGMYSGELRTRGASGEPVDPVRRDAFNEAVKALTAAFKSAGYWPSGKVEGKFQAALDAAMTAAGQETVDYVEYVESVLDDTDEGKRLLADAKKRHEARNKMATSLMPGLVKTPKAA